MGPDLNTVVDQPFAYTLWQFHVLQDSDRKRDWVKRMDAVHAAQLTGLAFHAYGKLEDERKAAIADAAGPISKALVESTVRRGRTLADRITRGAVLSN